MAAEPSLESVAKLNDLVDDFRAGVEVKNRTYYLKTYKDCFIGSEAVDYLVSNNSKISSRAQAVHVGQLMLEAGIFAHVTGDHGFKDENLYYRFNNDTEVRASSSEASSEAREPTRFAAFGGAFVQRILSALEGQYADDEGLDDFRGLSPRDEHNTALLEAVHPPEWQDPAVVPNYNFVVIGAGTAGLVTAIGSAGLGAKVALIEAHLMGGDCLNVGCVPSKALIRCARAVYEARTGGRFGVSCEGVAVDFPAIMERMRKIRADISENDSAERFAAAGVDVFFGKAKFIDKNTVQVNGKNLKFSRACVATGGRPGIPNIPGLAQAAPLTNHTVFNLTELPRRLLVIGTGPIGCELAQCFARFGSDVTLMGRSDEILRNEDPEAAFILKNQLRSEGVTIETGVAYNHVYVNGDKEKVLNFTPQGSEVDQEYAFDEILVAAGRRPNVEGLNLEAAGIAYDTEEGIIVNDYLRTTNPRVYAAGDVCTRFQFTHIADSMARIVIRNALFFGSSKMSDLVIPWATYTQPEIAHVGLYASDLEREGVVHKVWKRALKTNDRAICDGDTEGFVKIMSDPAGKIMGATVVADHAGEMISEITVAIQAGLGLDGLANVIHPYPTQSLELKRLGDDFNKTKLTPFVAGLLGTLVEWQR